MTDDPAKLAAARCVVAYLKATRNLGLPVKRRIEALQDTVFVAELLDKECIDAYALANATSVLEKKLRGIRLDGDEANPDL